MGTATQRIPPPPPILTLPEAAAYLRVASERSGIGEAGRGAELQARETVSV